MGHAPEGGYYEPVNGKKRLRHRLRERVNDSYEHWRIDLRYKLWQSERRFDFISP